LTDCSVRVPATTYQAITSAPVIHAPVEDEYPLWLAAKVSLVKAMVSWPAYPHLPYMPIPGPYLRRLPIPVSSSHANFEQWAHRQSFFITWNSHELRRLPPVARRQFFAAVPKRFAQMDARIVCNTGGSLVAQYDREEIYWSCRASHSVTMAIWVTEYLLMACRRCYF